VAAESESDGEGGAGLDFDVDPEHPKIMPLGLCLCEMYLLLKGLLRGMKSRSADWQGSVIGERVTSRQRDGHILAAAVLVDLYMRDQIDISHWTLNEGNISVAYQVRKRKGIAPMEHFLEEYVNETEHIFSDMLLPLDLGEAPIWASLEARGVIDNHRGSWARAYICGFITVDVWDLSRPDILLDLRDGYLTAARILYDTTVKNLMDEEPNDVLTYCHLLQSLFDMSLEAKDGMSKVMERFCPPFQKGQLFPPVSMAHSCSVCTGIVERGYRVARRLDNQLAVEAADFNERVMERLEDKFFLSENVWEKFDIDSSGELTLDEFVQGMRKIDVYKDFRRESVPEDVLRQIVSDLAERLFHEVDINKDGTLGPHELYIAFKRRRDQALKRKAGRQWLRRAATKAVKQLGFASNDDELSAMRADAKKTQRAARKHYNLLERRSEFEWQAFLEFPELLDRDVDVDTSFCTDLDSEFFVTF